MNDGKAEPARSPSRKRNQEASLSIAVGDTVRAWPRSRSLPSDPDGELVVRVGAGDRAAARVLVARHLDKLLAISRRMLGDAAEAEDAVQDTFLKLWTHAARWQPGGAKFETWLFRVAINACYDRLRKRGQVSLDEAPERPDPGPSPERALQNVELSRSLQAALDALPPRQRAAILLCHYEGCGNVDAAESLGISVEAMESLLSRGRRSLRASLGHLRED
jgi:RNA polymerase sigma-70 factor (ECF subfamily)